MPTHDIGPDFCPWCGSKNDRASNATFGETVQPVDGDALLCFYCGEWAIIDGGVQRRPTAAEHIEIGFDKDCQKAREAWSIFRGRPA